MSPAFAASPRFDWGLRASVGLALAVFAYTVGRSARLSLTHDEALTYWLHATASWRAIWTHGQDVASNNHLLNTLLIKLGMACFGSSELVLRLPALLGHALYLVAIVRLLSRHLDGARLLGATALLTLNPMLLDFFSCARGYGLGIGLSTLGLECLHTRWNDDLDRASRWSGVSIAALFAAAVLANLAFANLFVAALGTALVFDLALRRAEQRAPLARTAGSTARALLVPALVAGLGLALVYTPATLARIRSFVAQWGGTRGFWADTVGSLVESVLYGRPYPDATRACLSAAVALLALASAVLALHALWKHGRRARLALAIAGLASIQVLIAISIELQHAAAGTLYALDRSAIYLLPPFLLQLVLTWRLLAEHPAERMRTLAQGTYGLFAAAMVLHGCLCLNLTHNYFWRYDANTKQAVHAVRDHIGAKRLPRPYTLGITWLFQPTIRYYLATEELEWIEFPDRRGPYGSYDFYYVHGHDRAVIERRQLEVLADFPVSGGVLAASR